MSETSQTRTCVDDSSNRSSVPRSILRYRNRQHRVIQNEDKTNRRQKLGQSRSKVVAGWRRTRAEQEGAEERHWPRDPPAESAASAENLNPSEPRRRGTRRRPPGTRRPRPQTRQSIIAFRVHRIGERQKREIERDHRPRVQPNDCRTNATRSSVAWSTRGGQPRRRKDDTRRRD